MPTVVFVSPKGGVGKTTAALLLGTVLARSKPVTLIDADPNRPIKNWAAAQAASSTLSVVSDVDEENILDKIEDAAAKTPFVIVDLEGTAAKIVLLAASQADLILIPSQGSQLDAEQAGRALRVVRQQERMTGRLTPYGVVLTRTNPRVRARTLSHVQRSFVDAGVRVLSTELHEREAFRAVFSFKRSLYDLDRGEVANLPKAVQNAEAFSAEVIGLLRASAAHDGRRAA